MRYRIYMQWQVSLIDITKVVVFGGTAYVLGIVTIAGLLILFNADSLVVAIKVPIATAYLIGVGCALGGSIYLFWSLFQAPPLAWKGVTLPPPSLRIVMTQFCAAAVEWGFAAGALYFLLPEHADLNYWQFISIFVIAYISGMLSQVPGGLGVFEAVLFLLLPQDISRESILAALITYRAIYYLLPLLIGAALMPATEIVLNSKIGEKKA